MNIPSEHYLMIRLSKDQHLIEIPKDAPLSIVQEVLEPYEPRIYLAGSCYLLANTCFERFIFNRAIRSAQLFESVNLDTESSLNSNSSSEISHLVKLRIAKAKASLLAEAIVNCYQDRYPGQLSRVDGKEIYTSALWPNAIASWRTIHGNYCFGWGNKDRFLQEKEYGGDYCFLIAQETKAYKWVRIPSDDRLLLEHRLPISQVLPEPSLENSNALLLGITQEMVDRAKNITREKQIDQQEILGSQP
jgi:hypothetical protein